MSKPTNIIALKAKNKMTGTHHITSFVQIFYMSKSHCVNNKSHQVHLYIDIYDVYDIYIHTDIQYMSSSQLFRLLSVLHVK